MQLAIGHMRLDEVPFVAKAAKASMRHSPPYADQSNYLAYGAVNPLVNGWLREHEVLVARSGNRALGFMVFTAEPEDLKVAYVYTRYGSRRAGVAQALLGKVLERYPGTVYLTALTSTSRFAEVAERYGFWFPDTADEDAK